MAIGVQPSFARGEIAPALYGRTDLPDYRVSLRKARNAIIHAQGGVSNRPGTRFIGPVKDHENPPRLFNFERRVADQYVLEVGNLYMRFIRNDGHITETGQTITGIALTNPAVITIAGHGYSNGDEVFISGVGGTTELNGNRYVVTSVTTNTFALLDQITGDTIDASGFTAFTSGGTAAKIYEISTPYVQADLAELRMVQQNDEITVTHPSYAPYTLTRADHDDWTLAETVFAPGQDHPTTLAVTVNTAGAKTRLYTVTAVNEEGEESYAGLNTTTKTITDVTQANPAVVTSASHGFSDGDEIEINSVAGMTELNARRFRVANSDTNTFELLGEDSTSHTAYSSGGTANQTFVRITNSAAQEDNTLSWAAVAGAVRYKVYKSGGSPSRFRFAGDTTSLSFLDDDIAFDETNLLRRYRERFEVADDYPSTSNFYEQRQVFGGSNNNPSRSSYSRTGDRLDLTQSDPLQDDDAFDATLVSGQVDVIRHYVPLTDLLVFTSGGEWRVNSGQDSAFAGTTIKQKPQSRWGSSRHVPIVINGTVLFVEYGDARVRAINYDNNIDRYNGTDLNAFAAHLLAYNGPDEYVVQDWTFSTFPEPRLYVVRTDGRVLTLTFQPEHDVAAWTVWDTDGDFEYCTTLRRSVSSVEDGTYFVVKRQCCADCSPARYIERVQTRKFAEVEDGAFMDAMLTYEVSADITNVTNADPLVITAVAHGFSNGDTIRIEEIEWFAQFDSLGNQPQPDFLNGGTYKVINATTDTFEIVPTTGTDGWYLGNLSYSGLSKDVSSQTTDPQGVMWNDDGTKMFLISSVDGTLDEYACSAAWNVASAVFQTSLDVSSEDTDPRDWAFNSDGTALFVLGGDNDSIFEYTLTTGWDLSTASYSGNSLDVSSEDTEPRAFIFDPDGENLIVVGDTNDTLYQYTLSTGFDISTASYASKSLDVSFITGSPREAFFSSDGLWLYYIAHGSTTVEQFKLTTAYDVSTAAYDAVGFDVSSEDASPKSFIFSSDGTRAYMLGDTNDTIYEYVLTTAWDLGTASHPSGHSFSVASEDGTPVGMDIKYDDGTKLWIVGDDNDTVYQYDMVGGAPVAGSEDYKQNGVAYLETNTVTGAPQLNGCDNVVVLADGDVIDGVTFSGGSATLPRKASRIHAGLRYVTDIELLNIEPQQGSTAQTKRMKIPKVRMRFEKSRSVLVGPDSTRLTLMRWRENELMGDPDELFTGDKQIILKPNWNSNGRVFIRQKDPLPLTLLSVYPEYIKEND